MSQKSHVRQTAPFRWDGLPLLAYKEDGGTHFKDITRQVLFDDPAHLGAQLRYFEIASGGHSTLERHDHVHAVMIVRGGGQVLVGREIHDVALHDLIQVPPQTWHQFRATTAEPLGFLCLVRCDRDKPHRPTPEEAAGFQADPIIGGFVRL